MDKVLKVLDQLSAAFHAAAGDGVPARVEQFDSHLATVRMVIELAADEATKEKG